MSDKRKVTTDALETLGTIIYDSGKRDAIHLAVQSVVAGCELKPGQRIGLGGDGMAYLGSSTLKALGIVDPFLMGPVEAGERFWLVVLPRTITSLRHVWEHPDFPELTEVVTPDNALAITVLEEFANKTDLHDWENEGAGSYETAMRALQSMAAHDCVPFDACGEIPNQVWDAYEVVTGQKVTNRAEYFSCAC